MIGVIIYYTTGFIASYLLLKWRYTNKDMYTDPIWRIGDRQFVLKISILSWFTFIITLVILYIFYRNKTKHKRDERKRKPAKW